MKRILGLGLVCLMLTNTAFATKARLLALGMDEVDNEGSYYIDDNRNIFLNVANVNNYSDSLIFEWGDKGQSFAGSTQATVDNEANPKAGGGFLMRSGDYVWGAYLGNESNTSSLLRIVGSAAGSVAGQDLLASSDNQIDLFLGSETNGIKWGANVVYTKAEDKENVRKDSGYAVRLGASTDAWDAFLNASVGGKAEGEYTGGETHMFDGSLGIHIGGAYNLSEDAKVYAYIKKFDWTQTDSGAAVAANESVDGGFTTYAIGYGRQMNTSAGTFFTTAYFRVKDIEVEFADKAEANNTEIPLTFGYEGQATSWLTLRGSITQNIHGTMENNNYTSLNNVAQNVAAAEFGANTNGKKNTMRDTTDVRAGLSLNFGKLVIDGLISSTAKDAGELKFDDFMSRVGATYSF